MSRKSKIGGILVDRYYYFAILKGPSTTLFALFIRQLRKVKGSESNSCSNYVKGSAENYRQPLGLASSRRKSSTAKFSSSQLDSLRRTREAADHETYALNEFMLQPQSHGGSFR